MSKLSKFFKVVAAAGDQPVIVQIRGVIGDSFDDATWTIKNTGDEVRAQLANYPVGTPMKVLVDSEGGSMQCALGIRAAFDDRAADLTFYNCGYMASSAAILPPTKSKVICPAASFVMIHKPYTDIYSANDDDIESALAALRAHNDVYAGIIAERIGQSKDAVIALMKATTWWTGEQACAIGYGVAAEADETDAEEITARVPQIFARYKNVPETLQQKITAATQPPTNQPTTKSKSMKKITAALVAAGAITASTEEHSEDSLLPSITAVLAENSRLKAENTAHLEARKTRVTAHVEAAFTDKVLAEGRKASLITLGTASAEGEAEVTAQIADLRAAKTTPAPRGAKPAKPGAGEGDVRAQAAARLEEIQAELRGSITAEQRSELTAESLKLRGFDNLFVQKPGGQN